MWREFCSLENFKAQSLLAYGHRRFQLVFVSVVFVVLTSVRSANADSPLPPPRPHKLCDKTSNICAFSDPGDGTVVYQVDEHFRETELYEIEGWHRYLYFSPGAQFLIIGPEGLNLLPRTVTRATVLFSIYRQGERLHMITLGDVLWSLDSLKETASHYHWGTVREVTARTLILDTPEGEVNVMLDSGEVTRAPLQRRCGKRW